MSNDPTLNTDGLFLSCPAGETTPKAPPASDKSEADHPSPTLRTMPSSLTPAMRQYYEHKVQVGEALLLFRMGDFYETFYEDAKTISRVLGLALTTRNKNSEDPIPLAGIPYHALDNYLARLVRAGYKVAISEQVEDPKQAKGVVKRSVDRIITPGTLVDEKLLDAQRDNYLAALCPAKSGEWSGLIGLACVELASGRFFAQTLPASALVDELARLRPAELIVPEAAIDRTEPLLEELSEMMPTALTRRPPHVFDRHLAERTLYSHFQVTGMAGFGFDTFDASLCAAAAVLDYLKETQKSALAHILKITPRQGNDRVIIDQVALRSLEIERTMRDGGREGSLLAAIDMTVNPMGARRLREWLCYPLCRAEEILKRQNAITHLREQPDRLRAIRDLLRDTGDIERICARVGIGRASPRDLVALGSALERSREMARILAQWNDSGLYPEAAQTSVPDLDTMISPAAGLLARLASVCLGHDELAAFLASALKPDAPPVTRDGGFIAHGYNAELDRLRNIGQEGSRWLAEFQVRESQRSGIPSLKVGYNSVFGYYIEITHQHRDKVPVDYVRKQTVRNAERYITDELKRHENEVLGAADRAVQLENELFEDIRRRVAGDLPRLQALAEATANLDVLAGLAELARRRDYCRPEIITEDNVELIDAAAREIAHEAQSPPKVRPASFMLDIVDGRHPVLDVTLGERFVPNDCVLTSEGDRLLIITGPNMAGKSTYIRQVALLVLLAQTGSYVPARSMRLTPTDRIFARVGASDELTRGHSTFMVEMVETARILNNATSHSLVILDEIGRGTSTYDGLSLAWAITEHIARRIGCRTLFATHYHELTELAQQLSGIANYNVAVREELRPSGAGRDVVFLHKILPGATDRSYGVHVAAMAGLPASIIKRSEAVLAELERQFSKNSRKASVPTGDCKNDGQLLLFGESEPLPGWWRELVDTLGEIDVNQTSPMQALTLLSKLQHILHQSGPSGS